MNKASILESLDKVRKVTKNTDGIEGAVLLEAKNKILSMTGFNRFGITIKTWCDIYEESEWSCAVNALNLMMVLKQLPDDDITIELSKEQLILSGNFSKVELRTFDLSLWPDLPQLNSPVKVRIQSRMVLETAHATAKTGSGNSLNSSYHLVVAGGQSCITTTDGFRFSIRGETENGGKKEVDAVIPSTFMGLTATVADDVDLEIDGDLLCASFENVTIWGKTFPGMYYNIDKILNINPKTTVSTDLDELINAIQLSMALINKKDEWRILLDISRENGILVRNAGKTYGEAKSRVPAKVDGEDLKICFNGKFLLNALQTVPSDSPIVFTGQTGLSVIRGVDNGLPFIEGILPCRYA
ncbi:hypothetical protein LKD70_09255 [Ruminococcus sp. CLA-AA-H200]|uniref:DNA polymerase III subunit beta n=1 Tax=Ruminococcus turbiniformis TaxID=2881258 RepID=A0ABS8FZJ5_9FIRM|nr:hypothetical protein [Ruminococcus turbiniformis]MCC2254602.1 hypothetical protein [Ruminococcus turbiniformis]